MAQHWEPQLSHGLFKWTESYSHGPEGQMRNRLFAICYADSSFFFVPYVTHWLPSPLSSFFSHFIFNWKLHLHHCLSLIPLTTPKLFLPSSSLTSLFMWVTYESKFNTVQIHSPSATCSCSPVAVPSTSTVLPHLRYFNSYTQREKHKLEIFRKEVKIIKSGMAYLKSTETMAYFFSPIIFMIKI